MVSPVPAPARVSLPEEVLRVGTADNLQQELDLASLPAGEDGRSRHWKSWVFSGFVLARPLRV